MKKTSARDEAREGRAGQTRPAGGDSPARPDGREARGAGDGQARPDGHAARRLVRDIAARQRHIADTIADRGLDALVGTNDGTADVEAQRAARDTMPDADDPLVPARLVQSTTEAERSARVTRRRVRDPRFLMFFLELNLGLILTAVALVVFKTPNHFALGGTTGLALILNTLVPALSVGAFMWILNIILVVLGLVFLDLRTVGWSVFASLALSAYTSLLELVWPIKVSPTGDMWLDLCFAVILPAIGSAIVFDIGASTGGTDILALILKRHTSLQIGRALMVVDVGIVVASAFLYGPRIGLYCLLGLGIKTLVVDSAIERIHLRKVCTVISRYPQQVEEFIVRELDRSATVSRGYGAYSGQCVTVLMSVLTRREAQQLRMFVRRIDPGAFMTIVNSSEIIGRGFRGAL